MLDSKPPVGAFIRQTYDHHGETQTRLGRVTGFSRWVETRGSEFDQTGKGEGNIVVICEYVEPKKDTTFCFGIPNPSVERCWLRADTGSPISERQQAWSAASDKAAAEGSPVAAGLFALLALPNEDEREHACLDHAVGFRRDGRRGFKCGICRSILKWVDD